jgi:cytochrome oxidase Cu insertion factor (SCO1/SenC/PrrC family)
MSTTAWLAALLLALPAAARAGGAAPLNAAERAEKARSYFTDTSLEDQDGRRRRFYDDVLVGKTVLLGFMFTRCEGACPLLAGKLNQIARALGDAYGRDVQFVTVSVDPEHDRPADLKRFLEVHRAPQPGWSFLTGTPADVRLVLRRLGQLGEDPDDHGTGFLAANVASGHWVKLRPDLPPEAVAETLRALAAEGSGPVAAAR